MNPKILFIGLAVLASAAALGVLGAAGEHFAATLLGVGALGMVGSLIKDAALKVTKALPNGAATIYSDGIDLESGASGNLLGIEVLLTAPALATADLGDAATMTYTLQMDSDVAFGSATDVYGVVLTQTGAGGAGAAAATKRIALPSNCERYIRVKAVNSAAGDASDKSLTLEVIGK